MGSLGTFHFLGVNFTPDKTRQTNTTRQRRKKEPSASTPAATQTAADKIHVTKTPVHITLHPRSYRRSLEKLESQLFDAFDKATLLRYITRWATWWSKTTGQSLTDLYQQWIIHCARAPKSALAVVVSRLYNARLLSDDTFS